MPQLFLILEDGNTALMTRALGDIQPPRFASQGLLSTIASWCMESSGHELRVIASTNVRVVYRRFDNHLLFVLVTSNLLLQTELLQLHLETLYDALLLLVGPAALVLDTLAKISSLKSRLRAPDVQRAVDSLIADDTLVPCVSLPVPQVLGLPLRDKAALQSALARVMDTLGCQHAALISEGYYLAATHGWWALLNAREQMLLQNVATQHALRHADDCPPELLVHVRKRQYEAPFRLRLLRLQEAVLLAVLFEHNSSVTPPPLKDSEELLRVNLLAVEHVIETPIWLSPPVPQFATITYDLALLVQHSPPSVVLLWGHSGTALQQGFNPLVSPTLRKQMGSSPRLSYKSPAPNGEDSLAAAGDGLQLFFRSTLDTLVSFVLQTWPQMHPDLQAALQTGGMGRPEAGAGGDGGGGGGSRTPLSQQLQLRPASSAPPGAISPPRSQDLSPTPKSTRTPGGPTPRGGATHGTSPSSRLGLSAAFQRVGGSVTGTSRLQALFGRSSQQHTSAAPVDAAAAVGVGQPGWPPGGGCEGADPAEAPELAHVPYEEVHAVIDGIRLLALLDRSAAAGGSAETAGGATPAAGGGGAAAPGDAVDVFMAFPKRVGRLAALEAAVTLRATYLMAYHDDG